MAKKRDKIVRETTEEVPEVQDPKPEEIPVTPPSPVVSNPPPRE